MLVFCLSSSQEICEVSSQDFVSLGLIRASKTTINGKSDTKARTLHALVCVDFPTIVVFPALMSPKDTNLHEWVAWLLACLFAWLVG